MDQAGRRWGVPRTKEDEERHTMGMGEAGKTFNIPYYAFLTIIWALRPGYAAETDQVDEEQREPAAVEQILGPELGLDGVRIDTQESGTIEALYADNWTWVHVRLGKVTVAPAHDERYLSNLARCEERVRHVLTARHKSTFHYVGPEHSVMTATTAAMIRHHGVESMLETFKECCPQRTQEIIGREPLTAEDLLEIQPPTSDQLAQYANYLSLSTPIQTSQSIRIGAADSGLYVGSATGIFGLMGRWLNYETYKRWASDGVHNQKMTGTHLDFALQSDYTMHLRGWIFFPQHLFSKQQCLLWEGFGMDLFNTLGLEDRTTNRFRTTAVLLDAEKAVPPDLKKPSWKGLNRAHALKQGIGPPNEFCDMRPYGCLTEDASATAEPALFGPEGNKCINLCVPCSREFYEYRTIWNCDENGRRCSRPSHTHKVLFTAEREDRFEAWKLDVVQKWAAQAKMNDFRKDLFIKQAWKCVCGRALHSADADTRGKDTFRGTLLSLAPEPTMGCDACYTDWSLHRPHDATVPQLEAWKEARAAWRAQVVAKPQYEPCICSTTAAPTVANRSLSTYNDIAKVCPACYAESDRIIAKWGFNMDDVQENARALRTLVGLRGSLGEQIARYPSAPNCPCAGEAVRIPALLEWSPTEHSHSRSRIPSAVSVEKHGCIFQGSTRQKLGHARCINKAKVVDKRHVDREDVTQFGGA